MSIIRMLPVSKQTPKKYLHGLFSAIAFLMMPTLHAQVEGTVFRDFNANGSLQTGSPINEIGLEGVTVTAYDASGAVAGSITSSADGTYSIPSVSGALRIEFTGLQMGDYSSLAGGTSVQFVTAPATNVNFAVNYPSDYCQTNPDILISTMRNGDASDNNTYGIVTFPYTSTGAAIPTNSLATFSSVGSIWGQAYQAAKKRSFFTAFTKRHAGFGPEGEGGVYVIDQSSGSPVLSSFSLANVTPANGGTIDLGTIDRTSDANHTLGSNGSANIDIDAFPKVGNTSFGDAEISEDGNTLWIANLNQTALISVDVSGATLPGTVNQYVLTGLPTCTAGQFRIFGLRAYRGYLYVGGVCTGENSGTTADLWAYVLRYDPNNIAAGYTTILSFDLDYPREGIGGGGMNQWQPWSTAWKTEFGDQNYRHPEPILSNIDFAGNGDMVLALMDRHGHQLGQNNYPAIEGATTSNEQVLAMGDILHACYQSGSWVLEGANAACADNDTNPLPGQSTTDGPYGTGEYYHGDYYSDNGTDVHHDEVTTGSVVVIKGTEEVLATTYDPVMPSGWQTQGMQRYSTETGDLLNAYRIVDNEGTNTFGKGAGLGDIEALCNPAPLEIGNRIWSDTDSDGIQDANEMGIDGITVELYEGTTLVGTAITANGGQWYFNNSNVNQNGATELKPHTAYTIRVASTQFPSGQILTDTNMGGTGQPDVRDNDATLVGSNAEIAYTTGGYGQNDHTLDIGLRLPTPDLSLTKTVNTAIATLNSQVTFTLTLTNDNATTVTGVVITDQLPAGVTYVSSSDPANVSVSGSTITWNVGTFLGTDAPKTLDITVTASSEGSFVNNTEITAMNETDGDSTPNNDVTGEDDQDQACFSVPVSLCSDNATANITVTASAATSYQWYVSTDNGATYTALSGQTSQTLVIDNTLMGGNNVTKYFKVAYNGAAITDSCGNVMCCPVIVTTQTCIVCPAPKCITIGITKH